MLVKHFNLEKHEPIMKYVILVFKSHINYTAKNKKPYQLMILYCIK